MKKASIYIIVLLLVSVITISGTYAFFSATTKNDNAINTETHQLLVKYSGDIEISGDIELVRTKEEGFRRELKISLDEKSLAAKANFYIHVDEINQEFQSEAVKWEIYELINNEEKYINSGNFSNVKLNGMNYIAEGLSLNTTTRTFVVYIWINGEEAGNEIIGAKFLGYIGAETSTVSGELSDEK